MRALWCLLVGACATDPTRVVVYAPDDELDVVTDFVHTMDDDRVEVLPYELWTGGGVVPGAIPILLADDPGWPEGGYRVDAIADDGVLVAQAGGVLGHLYGVTDALEAMGWRFLHPHRTHGPDTLAFPPSDTPSLGVDRVPETARRGLHLHTLHPIEGMYDAWIPSDAGVDRMTHVIDWVVRNRGNHLQWVALDDITDNPDTRAAWAAHTKQILDAAHARGVTTGLGIQLFGSGNLQNAFDLVDDAKTPDDQIAQMQPRIHALTDGLDFDLFNLSFGEFFGEDPEPFIAAVERAYDQTQLAQPGVEMTTVLHVGDDLRVTYEGTDWIYYFLATFADRDITHWVHTVMYYNLFEDPGGAYHHEDFDQHRGYLLDQLKAQAPVGYFPESAYWIAFDGSVPRFLPLYPKSRWTDLARIADQAFLDGVPGLQDHVLFQSGWEWGYWLHDAAVLRNTYGLTEEWCDVPRERLTVLTDGDAWASAYCALGEVQQTALIDERLTPWLASWDAIMDLGYTQDIVSQPERPSPKKLMALRGAEAQDFGAQMVELDVYAGEVETLRDSVSDLDTSDPFTAELADGFAIAALRARFAWHVGQSIVEAFDPPGATAHLDAAQVLFDEARAVVDRRHANLHDPVGTRLITPNDNPTIYQYGYLLRADELCFWTRELVSTRNAVLGETGEVPGCAL